MPGQLGRLLIGGVTYYVFADSGRRWRIVDEGDRQMGYVRSAEPGRRRGGLIWDAFVNDGSVVSRFHKRRSDAAEALVAYPGVQAQATKGSGGLFE